MAEIGADHTAVGRASAASPAGIPLCSVVVELGRLLERRIQHRTAEHAVSANQAMALMKIFHRPGISRADLARDLQVSPQAVGQLLIQLLNKDLVARTAPSPGAPIEIELTEQGFRVLTLNRPAFEAMDHDLLLYFRPNLATALDGALRHILAKLDPA